MTVVVPAAVAATKAFIILLVPFCCRREGSVGRERGEGVGGGRDTAGCLERVHLEDAHRAVPDNRLGLRDFLRVRRLRLLAAIEAHETYPQPCGETLCKQSMTPSQAKRVPSGMPSSLEAALITPSSPNLPSSTHRCEAARRLTAAPRPVRHLSEMMKSHGSRILTPLSLAFAMIFGTSLAPSSS